MFIISIIYTAANYPISAFQHSNFLFSTPHFPFFTPIQPSNSSPISPFILPYPLLSPHNPAIPESVFCRPCTFATSFKANR